MSRALRRARNARSRSTRARSVRASARHHRERHDRAGLGEASQGRRSESHQFTRGARQAAAAAQIRSLGAAEGKAAVRRLQCRRATGQGERLHMSPGPIFEPQGHGEDFVATARALFAAGFRPGDIVHNSFSLSPDARRLDPRRRRARARLRRDPRRPRQHRAAARSDRTLQADRLYRHAGLPEDPARHGGKDRQGRLLDQRRPCLAARRCRPRCAPNYEPRLRRATMLCHRRDRHHRLRERRRARA